MKHENELKLKIGNGSFHEAVDFDLLKMQYHYQYVKIEIVIQIKNNVISKDKLQFNYDLLQSFKQLYVVKGGKTQAAKSYSTQHFL